MPRAIKLSRLFSRKPRGGLLLVVCGVASLPYSCASLNVIGPSPGARCSEGVYIDADGIVPVTAPQPLSGTANPSKQAKAIYPSRGFMVHSFPAARVFPGM